MDEDERDRIERMFLAQGVNPFHILQAKAHLAGMRAIDLEKHRPEPRALSRVPVAVLRQYGVVPVTIAIRDGTQEQVLVLAVANAEDLSAIDAVRAVCGCKVQPVLVAQEQIAAALASLETGGN